MQGAVSVISSLKLENPSIFFQAEEGIRDLTVPGVQRCALPISLHPGLPRRDRGRFTEANAERLPSRRRDDPPLLELGAPLRAHRTRTRPAPRRHHRAALEPVDRKSVV